MKRTPRFSKSGAGVRPSSVMLRPSASRRSIKRRPRKPVPPVTSTEELRAPSIGFIAGCAFRPLRERQTVDFRVMPDIDRKALAEIEPIYCDGVDVLQREFAEFAREHASFI